MIALYVSTLAWAAGGGGADAGHGSHGVPWDMIALQAANVVIFVILLGWLARKPVGDALKNRSLAVSRQLEEAARLKEEAAARAADIESKLVSLAKRVEDMKAEAAVEADKEAKRLEDRAHADAARIKDTAERTIREESTRARNELRAEAARLSVQLARETLKRSVTAEDQDRLAREFLSAVEKETPNG